MSFSANSQPSRPVAPQPIQYGAIEARTMPSQPCDKCGIDVDPEIQDKCPSCGRKIKAISQPTIEPPPLPDDFEPDYGEVDWQPSDIPPPPPPADAPAARTGGFFTSIGVRVLIGLVIFGGVSAWGAITSADRDETGTIVDEGDVAASELVVGDCLQDPGEDVFEEVRGVSCDAPHDFEIYHLATVSGLSYPSDAAFEEAAGQHCLPAFRSYTGEVYQDSDLWIGYFVPDSRAWDDGDRIMQCYLYLPDAKLSESRAAG